MSDWHEDTQGEIPRPDEIGASHARNDSLSEVFTQTEDLRT
jgi:hypothetical protein